MALLLDKEENKSITIGTEKKRKRTGFTTFRKKKEKPKENLRCITDQLTTNKSFMNISLRIILF